MKLRRQGSTTRQHVLGWLSFRPLLIILLCVIPLCGKSQVIEEASTQESPLQRILKTVPEELESVVFAWELRFQGLRILTKRGTRQGEGLLSYPLHSCLALLTTGHADIREALHGVEAKWGLFAAGRFRLRLSEALTGIGRAVEFGYPAMDALCVLALAPSAAESFIVKIKPKATDLLECWDTQVYSWRGLAFGDGKLYPIYISNIGKGWVILATRESLVWEVLIRRDGRLTGIPDRIPRSILRLLSRDKQAFGIRLLDQITKGCNLLPLWGPTGFYPDRKAEAIVLSPAETSVLRVLHVTKGEASAVLKLWLGSESPAKVTLDGKTGITFKEAPGVGYEVLIEHDKLPESLSTRIPMKALAILGLELAL